MDRPARVNHVEHLGARTVKVTFDDGLVREFDFDGVLGGVLSAVDDETFSRVSVDPVAGTICWPNGVDLDPDVLHGDQEAATADGPRVLREYHLTRPV